MVVLGFVGILNDNNVYSDSGAVFIDKKGREYDDTRCEGKRIS